MAETEKITMNMSVVDLGKIDLLVEEGFYSNRTDFLRTAVRNQLGYHDESLKQSVTRKSMALGVLHYGTKGLKERAAKGEMIDCRVVGMLVIDEDVTPELATAVFRSIKVFGVMKANKAVKVALADRIS